MVEVRHPEVGAKPSNLTVINSPQVEGEQKDPKISRDDLDSLCTLSVNDLELARHKDLLSRDEERIRAIADDLINRDLENELPVEEKTFAYQRNIAECKRLRQFVYQLLASSQSGQKIPEPELVKLYENMATLLALERRKASWLDRNYYPSLFGKAVETARSEVNQFLTRQANIYGLESFPDLSTSSIRLLDNLNFICDGRDLDAAGSVKNGVAAIRMYSSLIKQDEWTVFATTIHEGVHLASFRMGHRLGLHNMYEREPDFREVNEAVTDIVTYKILKDHLDKLKTPLQIQNRNTTVLGNSAYFKYIIVVENILDRIPLQFFVDAMLNEGGKERLENVFARTFGDQNALMRFGRNLRDLYLSYQERIKNTKTIPDNED